MSISDEIRKFCNIRFIEDGFNLDDLDKLLGFADRIDSDLVEMPKDRDGVPIHVGDIVYSPGEKECCVKEITIFNQGVCVKCNATDTTISTLFPCDLTHENPDSLWRIADDIEDWAERYKSNPDKVISNDALDFADRIRKLADEDE